MGESSVYLDPVQPMPPDRCDHIGLRPHRFNHIEELIRSWAKFAMMIFGWTWGRFADWNNQISPAQNRSRARGENDHSARLCHLRGYKPRKVTHQDIASVRNVLNWHLETTPLAIMPLLQWPVKFRFVFYRWRGRI